MAFVSTYFDFHVPEAWQDTSPDESGVSAFTRWVLHVSAALKECIPQHKIDGASLQPGHVWVLPTYTVKFLDKTAEIYVDDQLLTSWSVIYDDPTPNIPKPFSLRDQQARQRHR